MTEPKAVARPKRRLGILSCPNCRITVPFTSTGDPALDGPWPQHRCGRDVKPFTEWREGTPMDAA